MKKSYKKGVDFVFEQNPELTNIGTKEQYSKYLKTIFPESKVKDIVYHGTPKSFEKFDKSKLGKSSHRDSIKKVEGFFFIEDKSEIKQRGYGKIISPVLLNLKNPKAEYSKIIYGERPSLEYDGLHSMGATTPAKFVAFNPSQIHILGSKKDAKKFYKFVNKNVKDSLEGRIISGIFILFFITGLVFASPILTGNVIGISEDKSNILGLLFIILGIGGFFIHRKLKSK